MIHAASSMMNHSPEAEVMYDPLTELYNRPLFVQVMGSLLRISVRQRMPVSLAIVSIDDYPDLCDRYDVLKTEKLIKKCAGLIQGISRDSDMLAHLEEQQFALLLYNCTHESAKMVAARLKHHVEDNLRIGEEPATVSIGLSVFGETKTAGPNDTIESITEALISEASDALQKDFRPT